jgi:hypothetical protein
MVLVQSATIRLSTLMQERTYTFIPDAMHTLQSM